MKKNHFIARKGLFSLALAAVGAMFLGSCAEGFDSKETFDSGVYNTVLSSPELSSSSFSKKSNTDGSESIQVTWKVVMGAGGYECKAYNVDDPEKPVEVATSTVDSPVFTFKCADDTKYKVEIRTLGNEKKNNTAAEQPSSAEYNTLVPAKVIPAGEDVDVAEFINTHLLDTKDEQAFELEANGVYKMESSVDFQNKKVTLRGDKVHHPILKLGADAVVYTSAQLKVKFINFDCTENTHKGGIIEMSPNPPASSSAEAQGVGAGKNGGNPADVYILQDPIIIQDCAFKNVIDGLFSVGQCSWGISDVRVMNSVVQMRNDGKKNSNGAIICGYSNGFKSPSGGSFWYGGIKNIMIKNSTIYNTVAGNGKNRMFRFNNKDLDRVFPTADGSCNMTDNTFIRVYDKKEFANNTPNRKEYVITYDNNIFYDCFRLQKFMQGNCTLEYHQDKNTVWGDASTVDGTDKGKLATEENPGFIDDTKKELDFTLSNYGINFAASGSISSTIGDPRWKTSAE